MKEVSKKIVMVGDFGVGKTSLIRRYIDNTFSDEYLVTIGVKISRKHIEVPSRSCRAQLLLWDIEGRTDIKSLIDRYLVGAAGMIVVGDLTRPKTLESIREHIERIDRLAPDAKVVVAFNKSDLCDPLPELDRYVPKERVLTALPTSAKSGQNVENLFAVLAEAMCR